MITTKNKTDAKFGLLKVPLPRDIVIPLKMAVCDFYKSCGLDKQINFSGFVEQTFQKIVQATMQGSTGDLWLAIADGQLVSYVIANLTTDIDNRLTYWISQAWVRKDYRGNPKVKEWKETLRKRAKELLCSHIVVVSSRKTEPYLRFLGPNWKHYSSILMEDI